MAGPSPARDLSSEIDPAIIRRMHKAEREKWLDTPLPGLAKYPREAARDPAMREQIDELFKALEYIEERKREEGKLYFDVADMRRELGLPPLGS